MIHVETKDSFPGFSGEPLSLNNQEAHKQLAKYPNCKFQVKIQPGKSMDPQAIKVMAKLKNLTRLEIVFHPSLKTLPDLSLLHNIKKLYFEKNIYIPSKDYPAFIPVESGKLPPSIEKLSLNNMYFNTIPSLENLKHLTTLNMPKAYLRNIPQSRLPKSLESLNISNNELETFPDLGNLLNLKKLNLNNNIYIESSYDPVKLPVSIEELQLKLTGLKTNFDFTHLSNLKQLNLVKTPANRHLSSRKLARRLAKGRTVEVTVLGAISPLEYTIEIKGTGRIFSKNKQKTDNTTPDTSKKTTTTVDTQQKIKEGDVLSNADFRVLEQNKVRVFNQQNSHYPHELRSQKQLKGVFALYMDSSENMEKQIRVMAKLSQSGMLRSFVIDSGDIALSTMPNLLALEKTTTIKLSNNPIGSSFDSNKLPKLTKKLILSNIDLPASFKITNLPNLEYIDLSNNPKLNNLLPQEIVQRLNLPSGKSIQVKMPNGDKINIKPGKLKSK